MYIYIQMYTCFSMYLYVLAHVMCIPVLMTDTTVEAPDVGTGSSTERRACENK